jgi:xylulokinase
MMLLGIDLGTSSVKVLLLDVDGVVFGEASASYPVRAPRPGWSETDPEAWWAAVVEAVRRAVRSRGGEIRAIGLSGQMHGVVLTGTHGQALRPAVLWADTRADAELQQYRALPVAQRRALANPITVGMAGPSLLWLRDNEAEIYRSARWALQPKDWLRFRLTEDVATDPSDASATLLYDVQHDGWAHDAIETLGVRQDFLPPILASMQVAGSLCTSAAAALGLPEGTPVAVGASDTAAAALGSALIREGDAQLTVGSGAQLISITTSPKAAPEFGLHLYRATQPHTFYTMAAMQNAGLALEWVLAVLGLTWDQAYELAATVEPGCDGLTFLPYLVGERTPHLNPHARGLWFGLQRHHTRASLTRAALEGVAFAVRDGLQALKKAGVHPHTLRIAGGGTQRSFWRQLLADTLREALQVSSVTNASARGAAFLAALATGTSPDDLPAAASNESVAPSPVHRDLETAYLRFQDLYGRLFD